MDMTIDQQVALDEALVPHASRLRIGKSNFRLRSDITSKESTLQLVYDVLRLTPFYKAFFVTANVPEIYMQEFWATATVHHHSIRFKMDNMKQSGGMYHKKNVDYAYHLWEDFVYQVEHKDAKKSNEMYYPSTTFSSNSLLEEFTDELALITYPSDSSLKDSIDQKDRANLADIFVDPIPEMFTDEHAPDYSSPLIFDVYDDDFLEDKKLAISNASLVLEDFDPPFCEPLFFKDVPKSKMLLLFSSENEEKDFKPGIYTSEKVKEKQENDKIGTKLDKNGKRGKSQQCRRMEKAVSDVPTPTTVASLTFPAPTLTPPTIPTITRVPQAPTPPTTAPSTLLQDLSNFGSLFGFDHRLKTLEANFSEFVQTNQFVGAVSSIPEIVQRYMDQRMNEAVKVSVQIQSDRLRDEAQVKNEEFLKNLDENIQKIIKEQVKEQVKVQVSNILLKIEKTVNEQLEAEVLTQSSNSSKTSYAALYEAYESDKIILDTYGDTVTLKRRRDDADKDEEPSAGSDRGSKRRRKRKETESTSASKEKATTPTRKSTQGSKSQQKTASESAPAGETMQTTQDLEEPSHQEFETSDADDQPIAEASQHPEWFQQQKKPPTPDTFLMNRLKINTLAPELLVGPTYELMKGSCKSLIDLEFFLEEVYKATTDQLDWNNPEGQQYPHNLLKPLPLIPDSRGRRVIPFDHFINNDLEYLRGGASSRKYTTSVTKTKAANYGHIKWIEDLVPRTMWSQESSTGSLLEMSTLNIESSLSLNFRLSSGTITSIWIGSRKANKSNGQRTLCFQRLSKNVHKKHRHPKACGRPSTRCQKLPKEAQPHKAGYVSIRSEAQRSLHRLLQFKRIHLSE
nr:hypothetical protein [Tanacetum cinerariifolium]